MNVYTYICTWFLQEGAADKISVLAGAAAVRRAPGALGAAQPRTVRRELPLLLLMRDIPHHQIRTK